MTKKLQDWIKLQHRVWNLIPATQSIACVNGLVGSPYLIRSFESRVFNGHCCANWFDNE